MVPWRDANVALAFPLSNAGASAAAYNTWWVVVPRFDDDGLKGRPAPVNSTASSCHLCAPDRTIRVAVASIECVCLLGLPRLLAELDVRHGWSVSSHRIYDIPIETFASVIRLFHASLFASCAMFRRENGGGAVSRRPDVEAPSVCTQILKVLSYFD